MKEAKKILKQISDLLADLDMTVSEEDIKRADVDAFFNALDSASVSVERMENILEDQ